MPQSPQCPWRRSFSQWFPTEGPVVTVRAPGRVNLIGEHTDYNDGLVLPMATPQALYVSASPRADADLCAASAALHTRVQRPVGEAPAGGGWTAYVWGVAQVLREQGIPLRGANLLIDGDLPPGAGLSSSAALEVGVALALLHVAGASVESRRLAMLCREAEHRFAGTPCGIMDQFACLLSQADCALYVDCRTQEVRHIAFPADRVSVLITDTQVRHRLADGAYADRVAACRAAVAYFSARRPAVTALRDVTAADVAQAAELDSVVRRRASHVVDENVRVTQFVAALLDRDVPRMGELLRASHASLRDLYEVSCPELDDLVDVLQGAPGIIGARLTGGGFGGSVVALAEPGAVEAARRALAERYDPHHTKPAILRTATPSRGAAVE